MASKRPIFVLIGSLLTSTGCASTQPQAAANLFAAPPKPVAAKVLAGPRAGLSKRLGDLLRATRAELDAAEENHAGPLAAARNQLRQARQSEVPSAAAKLGELQLEVDRRAGLLSDEQTNIRFARGKMLLGEMIASAATTEQVIATLSLDGSLPNQKNHWQNQTLRNDYDAVRDWGIVSGAGVALVGGVLIAIGGAEERSATGPGDEGVTTLTIGGAMVAAGAAVVGAAAALGHALGAESGERLQEQAQAVEQTRRIHDALRVRIERLQAFSTSVESLHQKLSSLQKAYDEAGDDPDERLATLNTLQRHTAQFMAMVERSAELLAWFAAVPAAYGDSAGDGPLAQDLEQLTRVVASAQQLFRDGVSGFQSRSEEIAELFGPS